MFGSDILSGDWRDQPAARLVVAVLVILYFTSLVRDSEVRGATAVLVVALGVVLLVTWVWVMLSARRAVGIVVIAAASFAMQWLAPHAAGGAPLYIVIAYLGALGDFWRGLAITVVLGLAFVLEQQVRAQSPSLDATVFQAVAILLTFVGVFGLRRARQQQAEVREARVEAARVEERSRLAREMHDVLAHSLSALTVQLDLATALLKRDPSDPRALSTVERAHALARQGLEEARRAVGALRGDAVPGPDQLPLLAEEFRTDTGVECEVAVVDPLPALSSEERVAIYRVTQEALTNVRKHAAARRVAIRVASDDGGVALTVENDGIRKPSLHSGGYGLTGMRERAELLGGRLEAGPTEEGYRVRLWLPA